MTDAVPELWEQISRDFNRSASTDVWIRSFLRRVKDGTATSEEASVYAGRLGTHAGSALARALKKESLPDGKLYWNIADRTIRPLLTEVHRRSTTRPPPCWRRKTKGTESDSSRCAGHGRKTA